MNPAISTHNFLTRFSRCLALPAILLLTGFFSTHACAMESDAVVSPRAHVTVVSGDDSVQAGKSFYIGLRFQLADGWHVYWSNPGDAGQAPALKIQEPGGVTDSEIIWPTPIRLPEGPAMVFAYTGDTRLPVKITVPPNYNGNSLKLGIDANWLVCADHCVPEEGHFDLTIPVGVEKPSAEKALIDASLARVPQPSPFQAHVSDQDVLSVDDPNLTAQTVQDAWFFPAVWGMVDHAAPQSLSFTQDGLALALKPGALFKGNAPLDGLLVLKDGGGHESYYSVSASPRTGDVMSGGSIDWGRTLWFALLGGLILNLMPCVFPVLAIKALSLVSLSRHQRREVRKQAVFYTLGVLVAFAAIAVVLLTLRLAGRSVGWGFQFQSPGFVAFMAWLLFAVGLNLSGVYIFGARISGLGESHTRKQGMSGSFFTGLLAVVAATPCVAPFLGAAIATALTTSAAGMLAIFLVMGIGLALPYALLTVFPGAVRILPRPGAWMDVLKQAMAFPMYGASAWLLWVLSQQNGAHGLAYALAGMIALGIAAWLYGQVPARRKVIRAVKNGFAAATLLIVAALLYLIAVMPAAATHAAGNTLANEEPYSETRLAALQAAGQPVFVDMTAAWCITCLVNERVAIAPDDVQAVFARDHIAYLKGDWTQQDPSITRFLQQHDSDGVPLYVYYPPGHGDPVMLPQILTPDIVLHTIHPS